MDAKAIRTADRRVLVGYVAAAAENARGLLADAEMLLETGRWVRAYSLAALAAEAWAKAYAVLTLSFMPPEVRARIPVRKFLRMRARSLASPGTGRSSPSRRPRMQAPGMPGARRSSFEAA